MITGITIENFKGIREDLHRVMVLSCEQPKRLLFSERLLLKLK